MLSHEVSVWRLSEWLVRLGHYWPVPIDILGFAHIPRELFEHHLPESSRAIFAACQGCMFVYHMRGSLYACDADDMHVRRSRIPVRLTA